MKRIKLTLHLHDPLVINPLVDPLPGRKALVVEFNRIAAGLLQRLELKPSKKLRDAIRTTRPFRELQNGARITFAPGQEPHDRQTLIIRDPTIRVVTIPRR